MTMQLSPVVNYANIDFTTKESVNVLPKQYNFVKKWKNHAYVAQNRYK